MLSVVLKKYGELGAVVEREADLKRGDGVLSCSFIRRIIDIHKVGMRFAVKLSFASSQLRKLSV